jgi:hypothetical protein
MWLHKVVDLYNETSLLLTLSQLNKEIFLFSKLTAEFERYAYEQFFFDFSSQLLNQNNFLRDSFVIRVSKQDKIMVILQDFTVLLKILNIILVTG